MKKITLSILAFFVFTMSVSSRSFTEEVCNSNITSSSQADVDAVTCTQVDGRLNISGPDIPNIVNGFGNDTGYLTNHIVAAALPSAISCEGDVILTSQAEVDAFHCTEVGRFLRITGNDITNLDALSSLKKVGALVIENNPNLRNVDGLSALSKTGVQDRSASFSITNNPMPTNLDGFQSLDSVGGNIIIYGNESLTSINGFPMLKKAHSISITNNAALESIDGFNNVTEMYSYSAGAIYHPVELRIEENFSLERVNGFSLLKSLSGTGGAFLYINNNDALPGFNGLSSLLEIGTISKDAGLFINGYFNPSVPQAGNYTLTGTPYSASSAGGNAGSSRTIHFKVVNKKTNNESTARVIPGNTESNPSKNESSVLTLYPVPVDDQLNVVIESASLENISIAILNVYGLVVYKDTYKGPSAVDTSNLRSGVYFLQVVGAEGYQEVKKFIKN